jgi:hypothetical protein
MNMNQRLENSMMNELNAMTCAVWFGREKYESANDGKGRMVA